MATVTSTAGAIQASLPGVLGIQRIKGNASQALAVTTSDSNEQYYDALYIGVTGDVTVDMIGRPGEAGTTSVLFKAVPVGMLPVSVVRVRSTGTTATNIVGLLW